MTDEEYYSIPYSVQFERYRHGFKPIYQWGRSDMIPNEDSKVKIYMKFKHVVQPAVLVDVHRIVQVNESSQRKLPF